MFSTSSIGVANATPFTDQPFVLSTLFTLISNDQLTPCFIRRFSSSSRVIQPQPHVQVFYRDLLPDGLDYEALHVFGTAGLTYSQMDWVEIATLLKLQQQTGLGPLSYEAPNHFLVLDDQADLIVVTLEWNLNFRRWQYDATKNILMRGSRIFFRNLKPS